VLAWLLLAHLLADFVLQTEAIAGGKFGHGRPAWRALGIHSLIVAAVNAPLLLVFGLPGLAYVMLTTASHLLIDRGKIVLTLRRTAPHGAGSTASWVGITEESTEGAADPAVEMLAMTEATADGTPFDRSWSPVPAALFAADQLAHLAILFGLWLLLLSSTQPVTGWVDVVNGLLRSADREVVSRAALLLVVLLDLAIVNVRAASLFVVTLVRAPRQRTPLAEVDGTPSPARIGATIGILERLLICALMLAGAVATIGLVVAAKTLARFKQLDDREFAEYYLLGTLASVTIAVVSSLVAQAALV